MGFWTNYIRWETAVLKPGETKVSDQVANVRKNKSLFVEIHMSDQINIVMPEELWRENQPGDKEDYRDERCTAQKYPGENREYVGIDDYACGGTDQSHYVICEKSMSLSHFQ